MRRHVQPGTAHGAVPAAVPPFREQHGRRNRADARQGSQEPCHGGRAVLLRDHAFDPAFKITDLRIQHDFEGIIHGPDIGRNVLRLSRADRRCEPFAQIGDLCPSCCQGSANTQVLARQGWSGFWPEQHEPGDEFRIDPVWLRAGAAGNGKGSYLRRGQRLRVDPIARPLRRTRRIPPRRYRPEPEKARKAARAATKCPPGLKRAVPAGLWNSIKAQDPPGFSTK